MPCMVRACSKCTNGFLMLVHSGTHDLPRERFSKWDIYIAANTRLVYRSLGPYELNDIRAGGSFGPHLARLGIRVQPQLCQSPGY
jgi:hypothetical protein